MPLVNRTESLGRMSHLHIDLDGIGVNKYTHIDGSSCECVCESTEVISHRSVARHFRMAYAGTKGVCGYSFIAHNRLVLCTHMQWLVCNIGALSTQIVIIDTKSSDAVGEPENPCSI